MATEITNIYDLQFIRDADLVDESFVQTADIDASPTNPASPNYDEFEWYGAYGFRPIGTLSSPFTGSYDGQDYTITGLFIFPVAPDNYIGLFGILDGSCNNIRLRDIKYKSTQYARMGGFAGRIDFNGYVVNCSVVGGYITNIDHTAEADNWVGGFAGNIRGYCRDCYTSNLIIDNYSVAGNATSGGFVGFLGCGGTTAGPRMVKQCYADNVTVSGKNVGLFAAATQSGDAAGLAARIRDCYARGTAFDRDDVGATIVGGFLGWSFYGGAPNVTECSRCYVVGTAAGDTAQAFCAKVDNSGYTVFTACYYDADVSSPLTDNNDGVTGLTTAQAKDKDSYSGWDFESVWEIDPGINDGYPSLLRSDTMSRPTKILRTLVSSQSVDAGNSVNGTLDLSTRFGALLTAKIINGATGPTAPCQLKIETSGDDTTWYEYLTVEAGTANSGKYTYNIDLPAGVMHVRATFGQHTGQAVTVVCIAQELTSVG
jgi:hypothetical protein